MVERIEDIIYTIIIILVPLFFFITIFYNPVKRYLIRRKELKEDSVKLLQNESHPKRALTEFERSQLIHMYKSHTSFSPLYIIFFLIIAILVTGGYSGGMWKVMQDYPFMILLILLVPVLFTYLIYFAMYKKSSEKKADIDSFVYEVKGTAYKEERKSKYSTSYAIIVRGIEFDGSQLLSSGNKLFDTVKENEEVLIEYSPHSKYIWNITNTSYVS